VCRLLTERTYQLLADLVLMAHVALVGFVVGGLVWVVVGHRRSWPWVHAIWFRVAHLGAIVIVAAEAWLGISCPLTVFEMSLRAQANAATYRGSFVEHWLQWLLYYNAPPWVFALGYSLFALLVGAAWWLFPPRRKAAMSDSRAA